MDRRDRPRGDDVPRVTGHRGRMPWRVCARATPASAGAGGPVPARPPTVETAGLPTSRAGGAQIWGEFEAGTQSWTAVPKGRDGASLGRGPERSRCTSEPWRMREGRLGDRHARTALARPTSSERPPHPRGRPARSPTPPDCAPRPGPGRARPAAPTPPAGAPATIPAHARCPSATAGTLVRSGVVGIRCWDRCWDARRLAAGTETAPGPRLRGRRPFRSLSQRARPKGFKTLTFAVPKPSPASPAPWRRVLWDKR